ncbi:MAG: helix-turn-helix domain-containing protein [Spirochaetaceae bacterium]|nr:helix-turn-helix domain-containing protein [Spirochaetaceae bacterium]
MTESDLRALLGENLKRYRLAKGLSQAKLAEILDITPNFISEIETGKRWVSSDTLVNLAESLGIEEYELIKPPEAPNMEIASFIQNYTQKASETVAAAASAAASEAVARSLDYLRKQYTI